MKFQKKIGENILEVQIGGLAEQASSSSLVRYGDTSVLVTAQLGGIREDLNFFPLTCDFEERYYAAGRIGGSRFIRREGRPTTEAVLNSRMIDRTVRPLFPKDFLQEVQIIATCLSWDAANDPAILGIFGASLALLISEIPWQGPVGVVRIGKVGDKFLLNPTYVQREESELEIVFSAQEKEGETLLNMIEGKGDEFSKQSVLGAFDFASPFLKELLEFQKEIAQKLGKPKIEFQPIQIEDDFEKEVRQILGKRLEGAFFQTDKQKRQKDLKDLGDEIFEEIKERYDGQNAKNAVLFFEKEKERLLRENIIKKERRPDGRKIDEIRPLKIEAGVLPRTHGSGFFSRGETKILSILTLGSPHDQQLLEGMEIVGKKRFMHHYNFPPYSVGEIRRLGSPDRREIGHGMLVEKALLPLIPSFEDFPYTIRIVSEAVSSNGSTSMASVSAASLALMDAGVPIKRAAAGIALGLFRNGETYKILTDIQGPEDSGGEMDFKVAGTKKGITVMQMDVKIKGIKKEILKESLERAEKARLEILESQNKVLAKPRPQLSPFAPRVYILQINPDKIGGVIGPGGRVINDIIENCGVSIDIEESGKVFVTAEKEEAAKKAIDWIKNITREVKVGEIFQGKIKRILDFGAIVEIFPGGEALCHISQFVPFRVKSVEDLVNVGDVIPVKVINIDDNGRINVSAKEAGFKPKPRELSFNKKEI